MEQRDKEQHEIIDKFVVEIENAYHKRYDSDLYENSIRVFRNFVYEHDIDWGNMYERQFDFVEYCKKEKFDNSQTSISTVTYFTVYNKNKKRVNGVPYAQNTIKPASEMRKVSNGWKRKNDEIRQVVNEVIEHHMGNIELAAQQGVTEYYTVNNHIAENESQYYHEIMLEFREAGYIVYFFDKPLELEIRW